MDLKKFYIKNHSAKENLSKKKVIFKISHGLAMPPAKAKSGEDGRHHMIGDLQLAPPFSEQISSKLNPF
jgi:hypothetical protein